MADMTFKASLIPNTSLGYSLGSSTKYWNIWGNIGKYSNTANTTPLISYRSNNQDILLYQIGHATAADGDFSNHYKLMYKGTGNTPNNYLQLITNNATTDTIAFKVDENGNISCTNTVNASISGNAATATSADKLTTARTIDGVSFNGTTNIVHYGISSTGASTASKTVAITGFTLDTGAVAYVSFANQNTKASPTLNINSTGAKAIYQHGTRVNYQGITTDIIYELVYDGTYYQVMNEIHPRSGTCSTAAGTAGKTVVCPGFVPYVGAIAYVIFSNQNTHATPTLNINSTGAKPLMIAGATTQNKYRFGGTNQIYVIRFDGTNYNIITNNFRHFFKRGVAGVEATYYTQEEYDAYVTEHGEPPTWAVGDQKTAAITEVSGEERISLGNEVSVTVNNGMRGYIRLYGTGANYTEIAAQANGDRTFYLPNYAGTMYAAHVAGNSSVGSSIKPVYVGDNGRITAGEYSFPIYYSNIDYTNTAPEPGAYSVNAQTHPVTGSTEYGSALSLPGISNTQKHYGAQLVISSASGATAPVHAYIRRLTSTPAWSNWSILLDNNNYSSYLDSTYVKKSGDTMTGSLTVNVAGEGIVKVSNTNTSTSLCLDAAASNHGIWTYGYYDGSSYTQDAKWMVYRNASGDIILNGNAATATKLATARTLWGQSFDGSANVSGDMTDVGDRMKLPSGKTDFSFLTSANGAANGKFGRLGLADSYSNIDLTNYRLDVYGGSQRITTGYILFNNSADGALLKNKYNDAEYNLIRNHNNGNISISASSTGLYMGYENTTFMNWLNGKMYLSQSSGHLGVGTTSPESRIHCNGGLLKITNNSNTVTIGSQNSTYTHIYNSADIPFIFNKDVNSASKNWLGSTSYPWGGLRLGGTSPSIQYQGTKANKDMIVMIDNTTDANGNGIRIGGGGLVIVGGGESATTLQNNLGYTGGSEATVIGSDGAIYFYPGQDSYDASALLTMTASRFCAGVNGDTTREAQVQVASGGGSLYLWSPAATTSDRGLYAPAHGTGGAKHVIRVTTNNRVYFSDSYNDTATALAYSQSALAASAITYLTCWNGYELRAITKAEMANAVDSAHKWVRIGGDTMTGQLLRSASTLGGSWISQRDNGVIGINANDSTASTAYTLARIKFSTKTYAICSERAGNNFGIYGWLNSRTENGTDWAFYINNDTYFHTNTRIYGAVWNDYAEKRNVPEAQETGWRDEESKANPLAGRCVCEVGDDTMVLTTARLQKGCKIISDTFGFSIGETETAKTPIAVSGRALVYLYENREEAKQHIGDFVCSGPNGTVSIMTTEEYFKCPQAVVGTISAIPDYEEWGTGKVKVNGRIWIYVK